jgi:Ni/Co efflux regulator RcnB
MQFSLLPLRWAALVLAGVLAATPVLAKDDNGGGKHGHKGDKHAEKDQRKADKHADKQERKAAKHGAYFDDRQRESVRHYYTSYSGRCPPGLAKKDNRCMPRSHERRWEVGHRLPPTVVIYTVPQPILVTLPPPPPQHRYVRVAGDILLIAIGTQMVVDGINGLAN